MSGCDGPTGRALLIFPPFVETALRGPHLGAGLLAAILGKSGIHTKVLDLNIRVVRALIAPTRANRICDEVQRIARPALSERERGALEWFRSAAADGWIHEHPHSVTYALRAIRRILYPVPDDLEACFDPRPRPIADRLYRELMREELAPKPSAIGLSVAFSEQLNEALAIARLVRSLAPDTPILLGGSQINLLQPSQINLLAASGLVDEILTTNGELAIGELVRMARRRKAARVVTSGSLAAEDLKGLPYPVFDDISLYLRPLTIPVLATKGCYWGKCAFCDYVRLSDLGAMRYLARPVAEVLEEIAAVERRFSPERIMLVSDAVPPGWYRRLATLALKKGVKLKSWSYMMHHEHLDDTYFESLAAAGVSCINFGTESTNGRILRLMRKQASPDAIRQNLRDAHGAGIKVVSNVIADYPTIGFDEAIEVVREFEALSPYIDALNPSLFDLTAGTPAAECPAGHGLDVPKDAYRRSNHGFHSLQFSSDAELSPEQRTVLRLCYKHLAERICLRSRIDQATKGPIADGDTVKVDRGAFATSAAGSIKIPELDASVELRPWEADLFFDLSRQSSPVPAGRLRSRAASLGYEGDWVQRILDVGLVTRVTHARSMSGRLPGNEGPQNREISILPAGKWAKTIREHRE